MSAQNYIGYTPPHQQANAVNSYLNWPRWTEIGVYEGHGWQELYTI